MGWGIDVGESEDESREYTHASWADNIILLGATKVQMQVMAQELTTYLFDKCGYVSKPASLMWLGAFDGPQEDSGVPCDGNTLIVKAVESMEFLGTVQTRNGDSLKAADH